MDNKQLDEIAVRASAAKSWLNHYYDNTNVAVNSNQDIPALLAYIEKLHEENELIHIKWQQYGAKSEQLRKELDKSTGRLAAYEDTGYTPEEIEQGKINVGNAALKYMDEIASLKKECYQLTEALVYAIRDTKHFENKVASLKAENERLKKRGEWHVIGMRPAGTKLTHYCGECEGHGSNDMKYCPHCGADMGSEVEDGQN